MISVVIPVYNAAKYLQRCVASVLCQTYTDIECILVNDGSKDKSLQLCQSFAKKDSRIIVVNKENEGVDKTRFEGLKHATGEFVLFLDSDDWLEKDAVENLMKPMSQFEADVVVGQIRNVYHVAFLYLRDWRQKSLKNANKLISHEEMMEDYYLSFFGINILPVSMCATLYRRSVINQAQLQPSGLGFGEDLAFNMKLMPYVQRYYMIDKIVYNYRKERWGASPKYLDNWLKNARLLFDSKMQQIKELHYDKAIKWQLIEYVNYMKTYVRNSLLYDAKHIEKRKDILREEFQVHGFAEKVQLLSTMEYKDQVLFDVIQNRDVDQLFVLIHQRMMQTSSLYKWKVRLGIHCF